MNGSGACIVRRDRTILLECAHPDFEVSRKKLGTFAELIKVLLLTIPTELPRYLFGMRLRLIILLRRLSLACITLHAGVFPQDWRRKSKLFCPDMES